MTSTPLLAPVPSLRDYDIEVTTIQTFCLDSEEVDETNDFIRHLGVRVFKGAVDGSTAELVAEGEGAVVLSRLIADEDEDLHEVLDAFHADFVDIYDTLEERDIELPLNADFIVLHELEVVPEHKGRGIELAVFQQLIRNFSSSLDMAVTYTDCLAGSKKGRKNLPTLPAKTFHVPSTNYVVWSPVQSP
jgi:hypothetical protein